MNFLIFHHSFLSECILLIQFFWHYSSDLDLDILLLLLLWLGCCEISSAKGLSLAGCYQDFAFWAHSCQPFLCETECIMIIEPNSVFHWKGVCCINEGLVEMKETLNFPHLLESYTASACCKSTTSHSGMDIKLRLIWQLRRMVNMKHMNSCSPRKLTVLLWCFKTSIQEKELAMNYMVHVHYHESWGLTQKWHIFNQTYYIFFTQPSYNLYYNFLFPVQI